MLTDPKVLIIGAGAAGFAAAARLLERGCTSLTILEATNRIGGRIRTVEFGDNVVDLGAQWVHGERGNIVYDLVRPFKLLDSSRNFHDLTRFTFATLNGEILPKEESSQALQIYYQISGRPEEATEEEVERSHGRYFTNE